MRRRWFVLGCLIFALWVVGALTPATGYTLPNSAPTCANAAIQGASDYTYAIGSADFSHPTGDPETGSLIRWQKNGSSVISNTQPVSASLLVHFDNSLTGANGETPSQSTGVNYAPGKWGPALALTATGSLRYPRQYNFDPNQGTVELWVALRAAGSDPIYSNRSHPLFQYRVDNNNYLGIVQSTSGIIYAGGTVNGQWESAYGSRGDMRGWAAGDWHHLAFTYSAAGNFMRFYVDGVLAADTNEQHYWPPPGTAPDIEIGGPLIGTAAAYWLGVGA